MKCSTSPLLVGILVLPAILALPRIGHSNCCQLSGSCNNVDDIPTCQGKGGTFFRTRTCVGTSCEEITTPDRFGDAVAACDFNGDGSADLAIGVPGEEVGSMVDAGAVNVVYGTSEGVSPTTAQFTNENSADVEGFAEAGDRFGAALAAGDFDGDGFCDLAIGVPGEDVSTHLAAGAVHVLYGSSDGLGAADDQIWDQNRAQGRAAVEGTAERGDGFGSAVAAGDFNGDGFTDLAIGVPDEDVGPRIDAGAVNVLYGGRSGLSVVNDQIWHQNSPNVNDFSETGDRFGSALATGDFNRDGFADLAIGVPEEDIGRIVDAGAINVLYGTGARGLYTINDQVWDQNKAGIEGIANRGDRFGSSLGAGDFDGNGFDDLAIGVPNEDVGAIVDAGAVNVLYGNRFRLSYTGDQQWHRNTRDVEGVPAANEHFGSAVAVGDFDHDGFADLVIGVPGQDAGASVDAGAIQVLYGSRNRLTAGGDQVFTQDSSGVEDSAEAGDRFGTALSTGDFDGDRFADVVIGIPDEGVGNVVDAGAIQVLYGAAGNLSAAGNQSFDQNDLQAGPPPGFTTEVCFDDNDAPVPLVLPRAATPAQQTEFLAFHNQERDGVVPPPAADPKNDTVARAGVPPRSLRMLTPNAELVNDAEGNAAKCVWGHDPNTNDGENIWAKTGDHQANAPLLAMTDWAKEKACYNVRTDTCRHEPGSCRLDKAGKPMCGHFTQIVWGALDAGPPTREVGCGIALCPERNPCGGRATDPWTYVVCRYRGAGNVTRPDGRGGQTSRPFVPVP